MRGTKDYKAEHIVGMELRDQASDPLYRIVGRRTQNGLWHIACVRLPWPVRQLMQTVRSRSPSDIRKAFL